MPYTLTEFVPNFMRLLFDPEDLVRIAVSHAGNSVKLYRDKAIQYVLDNADTPNLWFAASAFDNRQGLALFGKGIMGNIDLARGVIEDIDYESATVAVVRGPSARIMRMNNWNADIGIMDNSKAIIKTMLISNMMVDDKDITELIHRFSGEVRLGAASFVHFVRWLLKKNKAK